MVSDQIASLMTTSGRGAARVARVNLSAFFKWAIGEGLVKINPVSNIDTIIINKR
jgi:hypothetical protein